MFGNHNGKEIRLSAQEEARLDEKLGSDAQLQVALMVQALPEEEPDLAWRSALSARLHETARAKRRARIWSWTLRPALGLGLASALAVVVMNQSQNLQPAKSSTSVEAQIMTAHREAVELGTFWIVSDTGENAKPASAPAPREIRWDESDLGTF